MKSHSFSGIKCLPVAATAVAILARRAADVHAQAYSTNTIRMVIAFPPGGGNDRIARFVGVRLTHKLGQQIVYGYRGASAGGWRCDTCGAAPGVLTLAESRAPDYEFTVWWGLLAPAQTPGSIVKQVKAEVNTLLHDAEAVKHLSAEGAAVAV